MKIKSTEFFATPKSMEELMKWCELHNGSEKAAAITGAMMAWNLACHLTNQEPEPEPCEHGSYEINEDTNEYECIKCHNFNPNGKGVKAHR